MMVQLRHKAKAQTESSREKNNKEVIEQMHILYIRLRTAKHKHAR